MRPPTCPDLTRLPKRPPELKVEMLSTNYAAFTRGELICRYVRREIRSLFDEAEGAWIDDSDEWEE